MNSTLPSLAYAAKSGNFLAADVEQSLIANYQATGCGVALNKLLLNYSNMCMKIANGYHHRFDVDDTYQDAMECLILSARNYKPELGIPFFNFAIVDVKRAVSMRMIRKWSCVTTPATKRFFKAFRRMPEFIKTIGYSKETATGLAERLGVRLEDVVSAYEIFRNINYSIDSYHAHVEVDEFLGEEAGPENLIIEADLMSKRDSAVQKVMATLNPKEAMVIELRRLAEDPVTLQEIGDKLGVSAQRVQQIETKAMNKLRLAA
jgi:RNA polymerase sigma-32 factor